eukprot:TRINITY_DN13383_c0_g4_i1.p4 TRINITY_DN13383_c0_g4~~TRINITY_DN13383_c0_g4_i1.p4  ORF type:complete len:163 (+),score=52.13 TRINITY_DN13383_c0_g4_i1:1185-1673(+)
MEKIVKVMAADAIVLLFKEVASKLKNRPNGNEAKWLQAILKHRFADVMSERETFASLGEFLKTLELTSVLSHLVAIRGKLELLLQLKDKELDKVNKKKKKYEAVEALEDEEVEGVEVMNIEEYKNTAEMMEENPPSFNKQTNPNKGNAEGMHEVNNMSENES